MSLIDNNDGLNENSNGLEQTNTNPKNNLRIKNPFAQDKSQEVNLETPFDQNVVLKQSNLWSRLIAISIMGFTVFGIGWAAFAKMEQVVPAQGQLKPEGKVKDIPAPINGVVKELHVKDGDQVQKDQLLVTFDTTSSAAELESQQKILKSLQQENQFYASLMKQPVSMNQLETDIKKLDLPPEVATLAQNRLEILAESEMYQKFLQNKGDITSLTPEQQQRLKSIRQEVNSRAAAAQLEVDQQQKQLLQIQVKLGDARAKLGTDKQLLEQIKQRNELVTKQAEESLLLEKKILQGFEPLRNEGAIATTQIEKQRQEVNDRYARLVEQRSQGEIEYRGKQQDVETDQAQIDQLEAEEKRLSYAITQAKEKLANTIAQTDRDIRDQLANNNQQLAQIDSQVAKLMVDNNKQIAETNSKISNAQQTLKYQEIKAPDGGTIFDLKAYPGYVQQPSQTEPLMKIVPDDSFIAEIYITNKDIGFVRPGQKVDVRIDSFPYTEFGDIKGTVLEVGSDALPPDQIHQFYRFPAKIKLDKQYLEMMNAADKENNKIKLKSGMGITANIKINENRTVLGIFTELFNKNVDSLKGVR